MIATYDVSEVTSVCIFRAWPLSFRDGLVSWKTLMTMFHSLSGTSQCSAGLQQVWPQSALVKTSVQSLCTAALQRKRLLIVPAQWEATCASCIYFSDFLWDDVGIDRCLTGTTAKYGNLTCYGDTLIMAIQTVWGCVADGAWDFIIIACFPVNIVTQMRADTYLRPFWSAARLWFAVKHFIRLDALSPSRCINCRCTIFTLLGPADVIIYLVIY